MQKPDPYNELIHDYDKEHTTVEEEDTVWLLSYADLMTLLFTFFVMLYASVVVDDSKSLRQALSAYLQGSGESNLMNAPEMTQPSNLTSGSASVDELKKIISTRLEEEALLNDVHLTVKKGGLDIAFSSSLLFDSGEAELRAEAKNSLIKMIRVIVERGAKFKVRIEGHTDDVPISKKSKFKSNWELSGARAAHIAALFDQMGFSKSNLIAVGFGDSRPLNLYRSPSGEIDFEAQRKNRRVVLTVYDETNKAD